MEGCLDPDCRGVGPCAENCHDGVDQDLDDHPRVTVRSGLGRHRLVWRRDQTSWHSPAWSDSVHLFAEDVEGEVSLWSADAQAWTACPWRADSVHATTLGDVTRAGATAACADPGAFLPANLRSVNPGSWRADDQPWYVFSPATRFVDFGQTARINQSFSCFGWPSSGCVTWSWTSTVSHSTVDVVGPLAPTP